MSMRILAGSLPPFCDRGVRWCLVRASRRFQRLFLRYLIEVSCPPRQRTLAQGRLQTLCRYRWSSCRRGLLVWHTLRRATKSATPRQPKSGLRGLSVGFRSHHTRKSACARSGCGRPSWLSCASLSGGRLQTWQTITRNIPSGISSTGWTRLQNTQYLNFISPSILRYW